MFTAGMSNARHQQQIDSITPVDTVTMTAEKVAAHPGGGTSA